MGIEVVVIIVVLGLGVAGYWLWQRQRNETIIDSKLGGTPPPSQSLPKEDDTPGSTLTGGLDRSDQKEIDDAIKEYVQGSESGEVEPLEPKIEDTQTMKAVSPKDTQTTAPVKPSQPQPPDPQETQEWMDKLAEEKAEQEEVQFGDMDDEDDDMIMFGDIDDLEEEPALDIDYPDPEPTLSDGTSSQPLSPPSPPMQPTIEAEPKPATTAHFSAFYPKDAQVNNRYSVVIYAHAETMLEQIQQDAEKFKEELGGVVPSPRTAKQSKSLQHGSKITVLLESEELDFEPEMLTKTWHGDWTRFNFEFRPDAEHVHETAFVRASIMVLGFEIAKIKFAIEIVEPQAQVMAMSMDAGEASTNPFAQAKMESTTTSGYDKIFISYSRKDKLIAEAFKVIQEAAGNDVFFDVDDIRTGADWKAAIAEAIDTADYMQVFWSENSAGSEWCGYEWDYALNYRCKDTKCREFIRPVWWIAPMPSPPETMAHLNFKRMNLQALMQLSHD